MVLKGESSRKNKKEKQKTKNFVLTEEYEELKVLTVENHRLCFDIA
jgi:hypothetical protein